LKKLCGNPHFFIDFYWRRAHGPGATIFYYNTPPAICQVFFAKFLKFFKIPEPPLVKKIT
jgi:hypothetical protein